jgi:hypothetical protein
MTKATKIQVFLAALFLLVGVVNAVRMEHYIRVTEPRDRQQEQCIADLSIWLQDWLQWRWVENPDRTGEEVRQYHKIHPTPQCTIYH